MSDKSRAVIVSYEEAQMLLPAFEHLMVHSPRKAWVHDMVEIVRELRMVRGDIEYSLGGKQVFLSPKQMEIFQMALKEVGM